MAEVMSVDSGIHLSFIAIDGGRDALESYISSIQSA